MIVSMTQYRRVARDSDGQAIPMGFDRIACQTRTSNGAFNQTDTACRFVRIATDTAIRVNLAGGEADANSELVPAGVEFFAIQGGVTLNIAGAE